MSESKHNLESEHNSDTEHNSESDLNQDSDNATNEQWKPFNIPGLEDKYFVSTFGNIKTKAGKLMLTNGLRGGYKSFNIRTKDLTKTFKVHQIVAKTFIPNPESKTCVNHKDGNKLNNHVNNLEWMSVKENNKHAYEIGLNRVTCRKIRQLDKNGNIIAEFDSIAKAEAATNVSGGSIASCCKNKKLTGGGYRWDFIDENPNEQPNADLTKFVNLNNYPNYKISPDGEIYSIRFKKFLKQQINNDGYKTISVANNNKKQTFLVHRLVAEHFILNSDNLKYISHIDMDKLNNKKTNLKWF